MTESQPTESPAPPPVSAMTAAGSMGRFLARNPQFKSVEAIDWKPRPSGEVLVLLEIGHPDTPALLRALSEALVFGAPDPTDYVSPVTGRPMVSLAVRGEYDGARWRIEAQVEAELTVLAVAS